MASVEDEEEIWSSWLLPAEVLRDSPSRRDNVSEEEEKTYRRRTTVFIEELCDELKIDWMTQATSKVFFHFFFARHSFKRHARFNVVVACIFLAAKVEVCDSGGARHLESLIKHSHKLKYSKLPTYQPLSSKSDEYKELEASILACERNLLHTVAFDLIVKKPQEYFVTQIKAFYQTSYISENIKKVLGRTASTFLKMSLRTSLCLQVVPPCISACCIALAAIYHDLPKPTQNNIVQEWYQYFELDWDTFQSMSGQIVQALSADNMLEGLKEFEAKLFAARIITQLPTKPKSSKKTVRSHQPHPPPPPPLASSTPTITAASSTSQPPPPPPCPSRVATESSSSGLRSVEASSNEPHNKRTKTES